MEVTMNIKELHKSIKNIPNILESWEDILVFKNSKPSFKIVPFRRRKNYSLDMDKLKKLQFSSGDENLSSNMDKFIYL